MADGGQRGFVGRAQLAGRMAEGRGRKAQPQSAGQKWRQLTEAARRSSSHHHSGKERWQRGLVGRAQLAGRMAEGRGGGRQVVPMKGGQAQPNNVREVHCGGGRRPIFTYTYTLEASRDVPG